MPVVLHRSELLLTVCDVSGLLVLVIAGWRRVLLKLRFQVFIILSSADEAGAYRVYEGCVGSCGVKGQ